MTDITLPRSVVEKALKALYEADSLMEHHTNIELRRSALVELRAALEQPQGEQEPVAYYVMNGAALFQLFRSKSQADALAYDLQKRHDLSGSLAHFHVVPLYTRPQREREPLTEGEIDGLLENVIGSLPVARNLIRAVERAHGIGGEA